MDINEALEHAKDALYEIATTSYEGEELEHPAVKEWVDRRHEAAPLSEYCQG